MKIETLAIHGAKIDDRPAGAISPPIYLSTTFERHTDGTYPKGFIYTRVDNPNRSALEKCVAGLEGGVEAVAFASGSAATMSVFQCLKPGDHVIAPRDVYYGTADLLYKQFGPWGLTSVFVDMTDPAAVKAAIRPETKMIWIETPSNPLLRITDIRIIAETAHEAGALCVCDNTWATPVLQRPLEMGVDVSVHSTTKYMGGHSDILGGIVVCGEKNRFFESVKSIQKSGGAVPSPFECWLALRGIKTLPLRVRAQSAAALAIARFLDHHPGIHRVHYPGLSDHPGNNIARNQMTPFGGMLSIQVKGGEEAAMAAAAGLKLFTRATSLGGVESLIEHRASIEGPESKTPRDLLRISVGLEHPDDLISDLDQALGAV